MTKTFYLAAAALLIAGSAAHAGSSGISFEIGGQKIHIDAPRNCNSLECLSVSNNGARVNLKNINLKGRNADDDDVASAAPAPPAPAPVASNPPPAPPALPAPVTAAAAPAAAPIATTSPSRERLSGLPAANEQLAPAAVTPPPAPVAAAPTQPAAAADPTTPIGLWQTADNKGHVRIEPCGTNLCGFAETTHEQILINMKPSDSKWTGRIHDPDGGSNYDSTIAMKGPNVLKVQGCAFGGLFCGGQTWKRVS